MPQIIRMTEELKEELLERFKNDMDKKKSLDGKFNFSVTSNKLEDKQCLLTFSKTAWIKFTTLVQVYTTEIGWYGLVRRINEFSFYVYDILTYPLEVTGTTITSDPEKYGEWFETIDDDVLADMKMHGHSHVNMRTTPSGEDCTYRLSVIHQFNSKTQGDQFYIFGIWNKSGDCNIDVYDYTNNIHYEDRDVVVSIDLGDGDTLEDFLEDTKSKITTVTYYRGTKTTPGGSCTKPSTVSNPTPDKADKKEQIKANMKKEEIVQKTGFFDDDFYDDDWYERYRGR